MQYLEKVNICVLIHCQPTKLFHYTCTCYRYSRGLWLRFVKAIKLADLPIMIQSCYFGINILTVLWVYKVWI